MLSAALSGVAIEGLALSVWSAANQLRGQREQLHIQQRMFANEQRRQVPLLLATTVHIVHPTVLDSIYDVYKIEIRNDGGIAFEVSVSLEGSRNYLSRNRPVSTRSLRRCGQGRHPQQCGWRTDL